MATDSDIGWTHHTANLWWGCVEVSELCDNCYAREISKRYARAKWGADEPRLAVKGVWAELVKWQREAAALGIVYRVFCGSMMDIFEKPMPVVDNAGKSLGITTGDLRRRMFNEVVPASPNLLFLFLSKRPSNITGMVPGEWLTEPRDNVMFGTSVGTQRGADTVIPQFICVPGRKFLSMEPLLEDVNPFTARTGVAIGGIPLVEQIITGVESRGSRAGRFADGYEATARKISQQCEAAGFLYFNKQMPINGRVSHDPAEWPADLRTQQVPTLEVPV